MSKRWIHVRIGRGEWRRSGRKSKANNFGTLAFNAAHWQQKTDRRGMHVSVSTGTSHDPASKRPAYSDVNISYRLQLSLFFLCSHVTVLHTDEGVGSSQWAIRVHSLQSCTLTWVLEAVSQQCVFTCYSHARWRWCWKESALCLHSLLSVMHAGIGVGGSQHCVFTRHSHARWRGCWEQSAVHVHLLQSCTLTRVLKAVSEQCVLEAVSEQCVFTRYSPALWHWCWKKWYGCWKQAVGDVCSLLTVSHARWRGCWKQQAMQDLSRVFHSL